MANSKFLSVIVLTYNDDEALLKTLKSIRAASLNLSNICIVIVDGGDGVGYKTAQDILGANNLIVHKGPDNGIFDAMNNGFKLAPDGWFTYLNSGDMYDPHFDLDSLKSEIENVPEVWLVGNAKIFVGSAIKDWKIPDTDSLKFKVGLNSYPHQSTFYNKQLLLSLIDQPFNADDSVADWSLSFALSMVHAPRIVNYAISINEKAGASSEVKLSRWALDVVRTRQKFGRLITRSFVLDMFLQIVLGFLSRIKNRLI